MRIDEIDSKHKEFKQVILNQDLTEEQLDEILPVIGALGAVAGGVARAGAMAAVRGAGALARGAGALARGAGKVAGNVASTIGRGVSQGASNIARSTGNKIRQGAQNMAQNRARSFATDTANKLANQNKGTQGTIGSTGSQGTQQTQLQRGQEISVPMADPKDPNKAKPMPMKVKNVTGREVEFTPKKKAPGSPKTIKFDKKDLAF